MASGQLAGHAYAAMAINSQQQQKNLINSCWGVWRGLVCYIFPLFSLVFTLFMFHFKFDFIYYKTEL